MPDYRVDIFHGRVISATFHLSYETDQDALTHAAEMVSAEHGVEVWCDERLVGSFAPRKRRN